MACCTPDTQAAPPSTTELDKQYPASAVEETTTKLPVDSSDQTPTDTKHEDSSLDTSLILQFSWIKSEMAWQTALSVVDDLYAEGHLQEYDVEEMMSRDRRKHVIDYLLKKVLLGKYENKVAFMDSLRKHEPHIADDIELNQGYEQETPRQYVKNLQGKSDFSSNEIDVLICYLNNSATIEVLSDHLLSSQEISLREHIRINETCMMSEGRIKEFLKVVRNKLPGIFSAFSEALFSYGLDHVFDHLDSQGKHKRATTPALKENFHLGFRTEERCVASLVQKFESLTQTLQSNVKWTPEKPFLGSIVIDLVPMTTTSLSMVVAMCKDERIIEMFLSILDLTDISKHLSPGDYRIRTRMFICQPSASLNGQSKVRIVLGGCKSTPKEKQTLEGLHFSDTSDSCDSDDNDDFSRLFHGSGMANVSTSFEGRSPGAFASQMKNDLFLSDSGSSDDESGATVRYSTARGLRGANTGSMENSKTFIEEHMDVLVEELSVTEDLLDCLVSNHILSEEKRSDFLPSYKNRRDRVELLLTAINDIPGTYILLSYLEKKLPQLYRKLDALDCMQMFYRASYIVHVGQEIKEDGNSRPTVTLNLVEAEVFDLGNQERDTEPPEKVPRLDTVRERPTGKPTMVIHENARWEEMVSIHDAVLENEDKIRHELRPKTFIKTNQTLDKRTRAHLLNYPDNEDQLEAIITYLKYTPINKRLLVRSLYSSGQEYLLAHFFPPSKSPII